MPRAASASISSPWPDSRNGAASTSARAARSAAGAAARTAGDRLERPQPQLLDLAPALVQPGRLVAGQEAALGDRQRGRRSPPASAACAASRSIHASSGKRERQLAAALQHVLAERPAHLREQRAQRLARVGRRRLGPQQVDQLVAAARAARWTARYATTSRPWRPGGATSRPRARRRAARRAGSGSSADPIEGVRKVTAGFLKGSRRRLFCSAMYAKDVLVRDELGPGAPGRSRRPRRRSRREPALYAQAHIPGAIGFNSGLDLQDQVRRAFLGAGCVRRAVRLARDLHAHTIVLYGDRNNWFAAYTYWYLKYYGHTAVKLLNGPREKWIGEAGRRRRGAGPRPARVHRRPPGRLDPRVPARGDRGARRVDAARRRALAAGVLGEIIAMPGYEHEGAQRAGHIPAPRRSMGVGGR